MTDAQGAITVGNLTNVQGVAIGHGARAMVLRFSLVEQIHFGSQGGEARVDPTFDLARQPLALPDPHQPEPEVSHLIGRSAELQALLALLQQTCLGTRGHAVWLTGRSGTGRHALAQRLLHLARATTVSAGAPAQSIDLLALTARFRAEDSEPTPAGREDDHWTLQIKAAFPTASASGGTAWVALMRQILMTSGSPTVPPGLSDDVYSLTAWLRRSLADGRVGLLVLRGIEHAPVVWAGLLDELVRDATDDVRLMVLPILTVAEPLKPGTSQPFEVLALKQCAAGRATALWLDTLPFAELEQSLPETDPRVLERLYELAQGSPLWIEKLWEDWHRRGWLQPGPNKGWSASERFAGSSARAHALAVLRGALRSAPVDTPYTLEEALRILTVAALEGSTFTVAAVADVTGLSVDDLTAFLADRLTGSNGLVAPAPAAILQIGGQPLKTLERFRFDPPITYHVLAQLPDSTERSRLARLLSDALERAYWPVPEHVGERLRHLLTLGEMAPSTQSPLDVEEGARQRRLSFAAHVGGIEPRLTVLEQTVSYWTQTSADDPARDQRLALAHEDLARALQTIGRDADALAQAEAALELYRKQGWLNSVGATALLCASLCQRLGQWSLAREKVAEARQSFGDPADRRDEAHVLHLLGGIARHDGDLRQAEQYQRQALELYRVLQDAGGQAVCHASLGWMRLERREFGEGAAAFGRALIASEAAAESQLVIHSLHGLGRSNRLLGELIEARRHLERALELAQQSDALAVTAMCLFELSQVERAAHDTDQARNLALRAAALYERVQDHFSAGDCLQSLAHDQPEAGWDKRALACFHQSLGLARQRQDRVLEARALDRLAKLASDRGALEEAATHLQQLIAIDPVPTSQRATVDALERVARRLRDRGQAREGRDLLSAIVDTYDRLEQPVRAIDALLDYVRLAPPADLREPTHQALLAQALARSERLAGEDGLDCLARSATALAELEANAERWPAVLALAMKAQTALEMQGDLDVFWLDYGRAVRLRAQAALHVRTDPAAYEMLLSITEAQLPKGVDPLFICPNVETLFDIDLALGRRDVGCRLVREVVAAARAANRPATLTPGILQRLAICDGGLNS